MVGKPGEVKGTPFRQTKSSKTPGHQGLGTLCIQESRTTFKFLQGSLQLGGLGPSEVSQGNSSTHIEYLSHPHHKASHGREWGACGETRPRPAANLVMRNRFELLAEEPEGNTDDLPSDLSQVETQGVRARTVLPHKSTKVKSKPSDQAADHAVNPELRHWQELQQLLGQEDQFPLLAQEAKLVAWAERYESTIPADTLGRWTIERMLTLLARGEDDAPAIRVAIEQILASPEETKGMVELKILQANITSYRAEIRRWMSEQTAQVACLQETHIIPAKDQEVKASWNTLAKQVSAVPAAVTQGEVRQGSQGGLMMVAANHINLRQLISWESSGKGFQLSVVRLRGIDLCVGNVYMESGVGPTQGVNPELLTRLAAAVLEAGIPFLVTGDWNCHPEDLSSVMFPSKIGGRLLFPAEPTISTGGTLDYAVCHPRLLPITECEVLRDTPFRPHAAVQYSLQLAAAHQPMLQAPTFSKEIAANIMQIERPEDPQKCVMLMEPASTSKVDATWAGFMICSGRRPRCVRMGRRVEDGTCLAHWHHFFHPTLLFLNGRVRPRLIG